MSEDAPPPRPRDKELRLALVCYGGISLAVYMHGITKEVWHLARASRAHHDDDGALTGSARVYADMLAEMQQAAGVSLRILRSSSAVYGLIGMDSEAR